MMLSKGLTYVSSSTKVLFFSALIMAPIFFQHLDTSFKIKSLSKIKVEYDIMIRWPQIPINIGIVPLAEDASSTATKLISAIIRLQKLIVIRATFEPHRH